MGSKKACCGTRVCYLLSPIISSQSPSIDINVTEFKLPFNARHRCRSRRRRGCSIVHNKALYAHHIFFLSMLLFSVYRVPLRGQILHIRCCTDTYRHNSLHIFILKGPVFDIYHLCSFSWHCFFSFLRS